MIDDATCGSLMLQLSNIPLNVRREKPQPLIDSSSLGIDYSPDIRPSDWQCLKVQRLRAGGHSCLPLPAGLGSGQVWTVTTSSGRLDRVC
ncbi:hypothetical protein QQF64_004967 [Cirrhinus molitorella]|uniref:Uncharacterized protein n=2 Tax=Cirrhinus molitorella TaxID=172907 RepID=A0AA88P531_9TELE|nr:hypothetical protein Q8A67_020359 [Cirrhinus molitorella]